MHIPEKLSFEALDEITKASTIVIISHRSPDADTIGSNLALRHILEKQGKKLISACVDAVPNSLTFLHPDPHFQQSFDLNTVDLIICVDSGSPSQVAFIKEYPELLSGKIPLINIDHHASNEGYGTTNLVYPEAASTTLILYFLFQAWDEKITADIATCLLYGLYYDTGSFMHSNTTEEVYEVAGQLISSGAKLEPIIKNLFHSHTVEQLRLFGKVFENAELTAKNIIIAGVKQEDMAESGAKSGDLSGAIDYLSMVKNNTFAAIISEDGKGHIRGSLRTKHDDINLSEIAGLLNGGGHKKASGFTLDGTLEKEVRWTIRK
jgi:phosphoesterase RecJ-like protein